MLNKAKRLYIDEQVGYFFHGEGLFLSGAADTLLYFVGSDILALGLKFIIGALASSENLIQKTWSYQFSAESWSPSDLAQSPAGWRKLRSFR